MLSENGERFLKAAARRTHTAAMTVYAKSDKDVYPIGSTRTVKSI